MHWGTYMTTFQNHHTRDSRNLIVQRYLVSRTQNMKNVTRCVNWTKVVFTSGIVDLFNFVNNHIETRMKTITATMGFSRKSMSMICMNRSALHCYREETSC